MNGLYLQLHAYMLRVAIPYGTLSARRCASWPRSRIAGTRATAISPRARTSSSTGRGCEDVADILERLADVRDARHPDQRQLHPQRHRRPFAGVAADEIEDPRPTAELIRQWSTLHPEFSFLPRKFKIAVTGAQPDRAGEGARHRPAHVRERRRAVGFEVIVGGGMGRTPMSARPFRDFLPKAQLLPYLEAILRVYNLHGRRDNKYKARIKILVHEAGFEEIRAAVEAEHARQMSEIGGPWCARTRRRSRASRASSPRPRWRKSPRAASGWRRRWRAIRVSRPGWRPTPARIARPATPS
jgi:sulfite reductase (NADPH) hemoprotein beta-component